MTNLADETLRWVERSVGAGARVVDVDELPPSSTRKHRIELRDAGGSVHVVVLRRYHDASRLRTDFAYVPAHEAEALRILGTTDIPAPALVATDLSPDTCDVPAILESWMPGRSSFVRLRRRACRPVPPRDGRGARARARRLRGGRSHSVPAIRGGRRARDPRLVGGARPVGAGPRRRPPRHASSIATSTAGT